jgi:hypothetical protein
MAKTFVYVFRKHLLSSQDRGLPFIGSSPLHFKCPYPRNLVVCYETKHTHNSVSSTEYARDIRKQKKTLNGFKQGLCCTDEKRGQKANKKTKNLTACETGTQVRGYVFFSEQNEDS